MAEPTTSGDEIMSLLLGDNEDVEEAPEVVEAVLSLDDVTVDVDQYSLSAPEQNEEGEEIPESFEFIGSQGPTLSKTVLAEEEEEEVELTVEDAPKEYIAFELGDVDPLEEVAEPVHTGKGGLYSPTVETPKDDDLLGDVGPSPTSTTPDLPDLPEDDEATPPAASLAQAMGAEPQAPSQTVALPTPQASVSAVALPVAATAPPALPDLPDDEPDEVQTQPHRNQRNPPNLRQTSSTMTGFGRGQKLSLGPPRKCTKKSWRPWNTSNTTEWSKRPTPLMPSALILTSTSTCSCTSRS